MSSKEQQALPAEPIGFSTLQDIVGYIKLDDGFVIECRMHVKMVKKHQEIGADGMPVYDIINGGAFAVLTPPQYKKLLDRKANT